MNMRVFTDDQIVKIREYAFSRMAKVPSSHGWGHVQRVAELADSICLSMKNGNREIIKAASLLHDIARADEDASCGRICHALTGSKQAVEFLLKIGSDFEAAKKIEHCILTHRYRNDHTPETVEAKILFDADKLDSIGAIGIGRAFLFSGEIGAELSNSDKPVLETEAFTHEDTAYREFMVKLRHVRDCMLTEKGKLIAHQRHVFMEEFFKRFQLELDGKC